MRSHMECKNKSNSSTMPQASSPVEYKSTRKGNSKVERFKHNKLIKDPEFVARVCKAVTQAICELYALGSTKMSLEDLYRDVYDVVLHKKGDELYTTMEITMTSEVQSLCSLLDAAPEDDALFLQELLAKWNCHVRAVKMTRNILLYLDRTFVPTMRRTSIHELGLHLWRNNMARSNKICPRLIQAVRRQRGGEEELVDGVNKMLTELGVELMDVQHLCFRDGGGKLHVAGP
ncbi:unnamed protein product [Urochloa decumbens]|uniref:Cullin N-terminal domain-containing protein n=1 Tax=Urochloa decumbens TaxID=240449 RepID=A0ABC9ENX5_9POAL